MSLLEKYLAGFQLRSRKPTFEPGTRVSVFITGQDGTDLVARVGDSKIRITDAPVEYLNDRVLVEIDEFDDNDHVAEGTFIEKVGESSF
ncbi:hypothetical protein G3I44_18245 [Halogeometricum borinquense]|uniref:DUF7513 domain-containing protein n=2 Tax=Halogeometricum borinquense TaxID=60847 RepID=E4NW73_HALBP|nr:hypothetical protein [Halogeometricum borinquense]ADQ69293.1 hypothetical protein Hbor_39790 [Halogeometricum borinquense DSM 11551]ELY31776.1 hypothetical protein C499_00115 [Halogeometricum borinquense DSM 11551]QIB76046.1 hypothetical protein G3I44_18245 [Halogeometricum borinquense]RYJ08383.1 hypothetical protein ELS19_17710 [Halogeometricum borinquense]